MEGDNRERDSSRLFLGGVKAIVSKCDCIVRHVNFYSVGGRFLGLTRLNRSTA